MSNFKVCLIVVLLLFFIQTLCLAQLSSLFTFRRQSSSSSNNNNNDVELNDAFKKGDIQLANNKNINKNNNPSLDRRCLMCKFSVNLVNYALKTKRGYDQIDRIANNFCISAHLESPLVCSKTSKLFNHEVTKVLTYGVVTPDQVCGLLFNNTCGHFHSPLDDWEINLQASEHFLIDHNTTGESVESQSRSIHETYSEQQSSSAPPTVILKDDTSNEPFQVIHLSDTHVDLNYAFGSPAVCEEPLCCQATSTAKNTSADPRQEKAAYWGSYGNCDVPLRTFVATLKHLNETMSKRREIHYIIWTGDIQPHDVWAQSRRTALQVYESVFSKIFKYLPSAVILPTFGNHEMIPVDSFSPSNLLKIAGDDSPIWLYQKFNAFWSKWLPRDTEPTITRDGFYATTIRPGLRAISLNTNFCHSRNFWLFINSTDPGNQLQWLIHELHLAELNQEKAHIIGHIPPGADDCMRVWSRNYHRIVSRYANIITGQFFGHTHTSEFELFYDVNAKREEDKRPVGEGHYLAPYSGLKPISVAQIGPSITTFIDLNPAYRIYTIDPKRQFQPIDYETFFVNLTQANLFGKSAQPKWESAGLFTKIFQLDDITPPSMHKLMLSVASSLIQSEPFVDETDNDGDDGDDVDGDDNDDDDDDDVEAGDDDNDDGNDTSNNNDGKLKDKNKTNNTTTNTSALQSANIKGNTTLATITTTTTTTTANSTTSTSPVFTTRNLSSKSNQLFELYRLFNSYSDKFDRTKYDNISLDDKKKFVCRLLTGQSHDPTVCKQMIPTLDVPQLILSK